MEIIDYDGKEQIVTCCKVPITMGLEHSASKCVGLGLLDSTSLDAVNNKKSDTQITYWQNAYAQKDPTDMTQKNNRVEGTVLKKYHVSVKLLIWSHLSYFEYSDLANFYN